MVERPADNPYVTAPDLEFEEPSALSEDEVREQVERLREAVNYHDYRYYVESDPVISDRAYDILFDRLETLEAAFDLHDPNSPTQRVGGEPLDELETVEHVTEMLSLDSAEEAADVREFDERVREVVGDVAYALEPKFDGFSVEVVYEDGEFDRAVTRGDGEVGEDVSRNVRTIRSIPLTLGNGPDLLVVRGEIYMPRSGFQDCNERRIQRGEDPFANPRNAAAGTVRLLDPNTVADRPLDAYFYDIMETSAPVESQRDAFDRMESIGLPVNEYNRVVDDIEAAIDYREEMLERRADLEYEIDGVVVKVNDYAKREQLGTTATHPRWAFAYKFPPKTGETVVRRIVVQVGRTGKLTPVALLDPVDVKGVTITRATLHNERQAQQLGVGAGARVEIERAGDVIPQVGEVLEPGESVFEMPDTCPACGGSVVQEGPNHYCTNVSCPAQLRRSLEHFCSKSAMDIEGVGEEVAELLVEEGLVDSVADLYALEQDELASLEGFGDRSARKLIDEIEASKDVDLASFLHALGIRHVGKERARRLADAFDLDALRDADRDALRSVADIGPEVAESIRSFFDNERNQTEIDRLLEAGVSPTRTGVSDELDGLTLAITGSIEGYTREELTDLLERHGATVTSSVSGRTDFLVVGETPGTTKRESAAEHGVERIDAEAFRDRILDRIEDN
ncbi:NAD-dependent DNA ligase LigA [Haloplanus halobius]|uniref:NAD-dependent DNA ligase LigA n=1 Tax=Haloplanus halobius TaxID=2934938 RepID=UPI00200DD3AE|nr:NAD-dependent DNA ligase LigA [Haloplanus sp. XH21]